MNSRILRYTHLFQYCVISLFSLCNFMTLLQESCNLFVCVAVVLSILLSQVICVYDVISNEIDKLSKSWISISSVGILFILSNILSSSEQPVMIITGLLPVISVIMLYCCVEKEHKDIEHTNIDEPINQEQQDEIVNVCEERNEVNEQEHEFHIVEKPIVKIHTTNKKKPKVVEGRIATKDELDNLESIIIKKTSRIDDVNNELNDIRKML